VQRVKYGRNATNKYLNTKLFMTMFDTVDDFLTNTRQVS